MALDASVSPRLHLLYLLILATGDFIFGFYCHAVLKWLVTYIAPQIIAYYDNDDCAVLEVFLADHLQTRYRYAIISCILDVPPNLNKLGETHKKVMLTIKRNLKQKFWATNRGLEIKK